MPTVGRGATFGVGFESTWATPVARTVWGRCASLTVSRERTKEATPDLGTLGAESAVHRSSFVSADNAGLNLTKLAYYNDVTVGLLEHCLGKVTTTATYVHTVEQENRRNAAATVAAGLTIEAIMGTSPAAGADQAEVFQGCVVKTWEWSVDVGGIAQLTVDLVAQTSGGRTSAGTPTYAVAPDPILFSDVAAPTYNARSMCARSISFRGDNGLGERRCFDGTAYISEPVVENMQEVTAEIQIEYNAAAKLLRDDYLADVTSDLVVTCTGRSSRTLTFTLQNAEITAFSDPVSSRGVVLVTVSFRGIRDTADPGLQIVVENAQTAARSNGPT